MTKNEAETQTLPLEGGILVTNLRLGQCLQLIIHDAL